MTAQFLALAPWPRLVELLKQLFAEGKRPELSYAWFITLGLQRIHGIGPGITQRRRSELRIVKAGERRPQQQPTQASFDEAEQLPDAGEILRQAVAGVKKLR